jgi:hypothetical protein
MIKIPTHTDHTKNSRNAVTDSTLPCVVCGKPTKTDKARHIHLHLGGTHAVTEREADELNEAGQEDADMGAYPIGSCCLRKHPELKPYADDCDRPYKPNPDNAGLRSTRWNTLCKVWVSVYNAKEAQMSGKWMVVCEKHSSILTTDSLRLANHHAAGGFVEFCDGCNQELIDYAAQLQEYAPSRYSRHSW